jgi:hypothetical protein
MNILTVKLTAGTAVTIPVSGFYFRVLKTDFAVNVKINGQDIRDFEAGLGVTWSSRITEVVFLSDRSQLVKFAVSDLPIDDSRTVGRVHTYEVGSDSIKTAAVTVGTAAVQLADEEANRRGVLIQPLGGDVYIGGSGVDVTNGVLVKAGQSFVVNTTAKLFAIAESSGIDVRVMTEGVI